MVPVTILYMSIIHTPPEDITPIDRGEITTEVMDYSMDYLIHDRNESITTIYFKTVPPCMEDEQEYTWLDIISQRDEIRAIEIGKIWCMIHVDHLHLDDVTNTLEFCIENYYLVQNYY